MTVNTSAGQIDALLACFGTNRDELVHGKLRPVVGNLVPVLFVLWQGKQIRMHLDRMPAPTIRVEADRECWAGWKLPRPISGTDIASLRRVAERLGGVVIAPESLRHFLLPLDGTITVDSSLTYELTALDKRPATRRPARILRQS